MAPTDSIQKQGAVLVTDSVGYARRPGDDHGPVHYRCSWQLLINAAVVILFLSCVVANSWADSSAAEEAFNRGRSFYVAGKFEDAAKWFRKAAEQGNAGAQYNLAVMYDKGLGVPQDYSEAVRWYRKAAEQGDALAQYNLGVMYANGEGVPQDYAEAVRWYRKAGLCCLDSE